MERANLRTRRELAGRTALLLGALSACLAHGCWDFKASCGALDCSAPQEPPSAVTMPNQPGSEGVAGGEPSLGSAGASSGMSVGPTPAGPLPVNSQFDAGPISSPEAGIEAEADAGADAASPDASGNEPSGNEPSTPDPCPELANKPARLCLGEQCLELSCTLRRALSLWLDPTTLPPPGTEVSSWLDRSGLGNHATRRLEGGPAMPVVSEPRAVAEELQRAVQLEGQLDGQPNSNWLSIAQPGGNDSLRFGDQEFLVLVAASVPPGQGANTFLYTMSDSYGNLALNLSFACGGQLGVDGTSGHRSSVSSAATGLFDDQPRLYGMWRRSLTQLELRLNGSSAGAMDCANLGSAGVNADTDAQTALGTGSIGREPSSSWGKLSAVVVLSGTVEAEEVSRLEQFLCSALGTCSPLPVPTGEAADPSCAVDPYCPELL